MTVTVIGSMIVCVCAFSRVVKSSEAAILKWAIIGQTSPNANINYGRIRLVKFRPTMLGSVHPRIVKMLLTEAGQSNGNFCKRSNWKHYLD